MILTCVVAAVVVVVAVVVAAAAVVVVVVVVVIVKTDTPYSVNILFLIYQPCKSDLEEEDEAYGTMSKPGNEIVEKQIQILE